MYTIYQIVEDVNIRKPLHAKWLWDYRIGLFEKFRIRNLPFSNSAFRNPNSEFKDLAL